jgi:hypothetical protein
LGDVLRSVPQYLNSYYGDTGLLASSSVLYDVSSFAILIFIVCLRHFLSCHQRKQDVGAKRRRVAEASAFTSKDVRTLLEGLKFITSVELPLVSRFTRVHYWFRIFACLQHDDLPSGLPSDSAAVIRTIHGMFLLPLLCMLAASIVAPY